MILQKLQNEPAIDIVKRFVKFQNPLACDFNGFTRMTDIDENTAVYRIKYCYHQGAGTMLVREDRLYFKTLNNELCDIQEIK